MGYPVGSEVELSALFHSPDDPDYDPTRVTLSGRGPGVDSTPVVYPDDQAPAARGYRYTFFGNAFFINDQGYLLTVAHVLETFRDGGRRHESASVSHYTLPAKY